MLSKTILLVMAASMIVGCTSVPLESKSLQAKAKEFSPPTNGNSGLYIFRHGSLGGALKKDVWVDGDCLGETAPNMFFYQEVMGNQEHKISTESEFSPNNLLVKTNAGENHFIQQYIKLGLVVGGAGLKEVDKEKGKRIVSRLKMAKKGTCSK